VHVGLEDPDAALAELQNALAAHDSFFSTMHFDPVYNPVRDLPLYQSMLREMNLLPGPDATVSTPGAAD
jgi:hypothetical protein